MALSEPIDKSPGSPQMAGAVEVPILEARESWNEYKLADGATIRIKHTVAAILRIPGQVDAEGLPLYAVKGTTIAVPVSTGGKTIKN